MFESGRASTNPWKMFQHKTQRVNVMSTAGYKLSSTATRHVPIKSQGKKEGESQGH